MVNLQRRLGYDQACVADAVGKERGLVFMWNDEITVDVSISYSNLIHARIKGENDRHRWYFIGIYGCPNFKERKMLWEIISTIKIKTMQS